MPKYLVSVPFTGYVSVEVEAGTEEEAQDEAFEEINSEGWDFEAAVEEMSYCKAIVNGNTFTGCLNEVEVEEIENNA